MPTQIRISHCFKSVLGMTLNCIRWESRGSGTERCYPLPSLEPVRLPIKGASRAAIARGFGLDTILGEQNTASKPPGKQPQSTKHIIFFPTDSILATWGRIPRDERWWCSTSKEECHLLLAHSVTLWHELLCITKYDQWLLKLLEKSLFFLQNTPPVATPWQ